MNAIYTVIENGRESYYSTNIAGGYSYPFLAYGYAVSMARTLNESNSMGTVGGSEMIPLLKANENFLEDVRGERLFYPLSAEIFFARESEMAQSDFTPFSITLDFDEEVTEEHAEQQETAAVNDCESVSEEVGEQPEEQDNTAISDDFDGECEESENPDEDEDLDESEDQDESEDMGMSMGM